VTLLHSARVWPIVAGLLSTASAAAAAPSGANATTVLVVLDRPDDIGARLLAELEFAGFRPARTLLKVGSSGGPLDVTTAAHDAAAQAVLHPRASSIEIWRVDEHGILTFLDAIPRELDDTSAVRSVERIRAALGTSVVLPEEPTHNVHSAPIQDASPSRFSRLCIGGGVGVVASARGDVGALPTARGTIGVMATRRVRLDVAAFASLDASTIEGEGGHAAIRWQGADAGIAYAPFDADTWIRPFVAARAGAMRVTARGDATPPNISGDGSVVVPTVTGWKQTALLEATDSEDSCASAGPPVALDGARVLFSGSCSSTLDLYARASDGTWKKESSLTPQSHTVATFLHPVLHGNRVAARPTCSNSKVALGKRAHACLRPCLRSSSMTVHSRWALADIPITSISIALK
jgi:hypothetical protein